MSLNRVFLKAVTIIQIFSFSLSNVSFALTDAVGLSELSPPLALKAEGFRDKWVVVDIAGEVGYALKLQLSKHTLILRIQNRLEKEGISEALGKGIDISGIEEVYDGDRITAFSVPVNMENSLRCKLIYSLEGDVESQPVIPIDDETIVYVKRVEEGVLDDLSDNSGGTDAGLPKRTSKDSPEQFIEFIRSTLGTKAVERAYKTGDDIIRQGEKGDELFVILDGSVTVLYRDGDHETDVALCHKGDFIGEMALLREDGIRQATVTAVAPTRILAIKRADFDQMLARHPRFEDNMQTTALIRAREAKDKLTRPRESPGMIDEVLRNIFCPGRDEELLGFDRIAPKFIALRALDGDLDLRIGPWNEDHYNISVASHYGFRCILVEHKNGEFELAFEAPLSAALFMRRHGVPYTAGAEKSQAYLDLLRDELIKVAGLIQKNFSAVPSLPNGFDPPIVIASFPDVWKELGSGIVRLSDLTALPLLSSADGPLVDRMTVQASDTAALTDLVTSMMTEMRSRRNRQKPRPFRIFIEGDTAEASALCADNISRTINETLQGSVAIVNIDDHGSEKGEIIKAINDHKESEVLIFAGTRALSLIARDLFGLSIYANSDNNIHPSGLWLRRNVDVTIDMTAYNAASKETEPEELGKPLTPPEGKEEFDRVRTKGFGTIQFGIPSYTMKDMMVNLGKADDIPSYFVLPEKFFNIDQLSNFADLEFVIYCNYFIRGGQKTKIIGSEHQIERIREMMQHALLGPDEDEWVKMAGQHGVSPDVLSLRQINQHYAKNVKGGTLTLDDVIETISFGDKRAAKLINPSGVLTITHTAQADTFIVKETSDGQTVLDIQIRSRYRRPSSLVGELTAQKRAEFNLENRPLFGVTPLGTSHGFAVEEDVTNFIIWVNGKAILVDPSWEILNYMKKTGLKHSDIAYIVLTHCHADHDGGLLSLILSGQRLKLLASHLVYEEFKRKASATFKTMDLDIDIDELVSFQAIDPENPATFDVNGEKFEIESRWNLHSIPTNGFKIKVRDKSFGYAGDTQYDPDVIESFFARGVISSGMRDKLLYFFWDKDGNPTVDLFFHEAGIAPLHTEQAILSALPEAVRERMKVVHIADSAVKEPLAKPERLKTIALLPPERDYASDILAATSFLQNASSDDVKALLAGDNILRLSPGEEVVHQGDEVKIFSAASQNGFAFSPNSEEPFFYIVLSGEVSIVVDGKETWKVGSPGWFGEWSLETGENRAATIRAVDPAVLLKVSYPEYVKLTTDPEVKSKIQFMRRNVASLENFILSKYPYVLDDFTDFAFRALASSSHERKIYKGDILVREGDIGNEAYIIKSGRVRVAGTDISRGEGEVVGEMALLSRDGRRTATLICEEDAELLVLSRDLFREMLTYYPPLYFAVMETVRERYEGFFNNFLNTTPSDEDDITSFWLMLYTKSFKQARSTYDVLKELHEKNILDLGCGNSSSLAWALKKTGISHVWGLDVTVDDKFPGGIRADAFSLPFADDSIDVCLAFSFLDDDTFKLFEGSRGKFSGEDEMFEHAVKEIGRVLKTGGELWLSPGYDKFHILLSENGFRVDKISDNYYVARLLSKPIRPRDPLDDINARVTTATPMGPAEKPKTTGEGLDGKPILGQLKTRAVILHLRSSLWLANRRLKSVFPNTQLKGIRTIDSWSSVLLSDSYTAEREKAKEFLLSGLDGLVTQDRDEAVAVLNRLGATRTDLIKSYRKALGSIYPSVCANAMVQLGELDDSSSLKEILRMLSSTTEKIRYLALETARKLGVTDDELRIALEAADKGAIIAAVRDFAKKELKLLESGSTMPDASSPKGGHGPQLAMIGFGLPDLIIRTIANVLDYFLSVAEPLLEINEEKTEFPKKDNRSDNGIYLGLDGADSGLLKVATPFCEEAEIEMARYLSENNADILHFKDGTILGVEGRRELPSRKMAGNSIYYEDRKTKMEGDVYLAAIGLPGEGTAKEPVVSMGFILKNPKAPATRGMLFRYDKDLNGYVMGRHSAILPMIEDYAEAEGVTVRQILSGAKRNVQRAIFAKLTKIFISSDIRVSLKNARINGISFSSCAGFLKYIDFTNADLKNCNLKGTFGGTFNDLGVNVWDASSLEGCGIDKGTYLSFSDRIRAEGYRAVPDGDGYVLRKISSKKPKRRINKFPKEANLGISNTLKSFWRRLVPLNTESLRNNTDVIETEDVEAKNTNIPINWPKEPVESQDRLENITMWGRYLNALFDVAAGIPKVREDLPGKYFFTAIREDGGEKTYTSQPAVFNYWVKHSIGDSLSVLTNTEYLVRHNAVTNTEGARLLNNSVEELEAFIHFLEMVSEREPDYFNSLEQPSGYQGTEDDPFPAAMLANYLLKDVFGAPEGRRNLDIMGDVVQRMKPALSKVRQEVAWFGSILSPDLPDPAIEGKIKSAPESLSGGRKDQQKAQRGAIGRVAAGKTDLRDTRRENVFNEDLFREDNSTLLASVIPEVERRNSILFCDTVKELGAASKYHQKVLVFAGTSWIPGYDDRDPIRYGAINPLLIETKQYCDSKKVPFFYTSDGKLAELICAEMNRPENMDAKIIVLAGQETIMNSPEFKTWRADRKRAFLVGVDHKELSDDSYIRFLEILKVTMQLASNAFTLTREGFNIDLNNPRMSVMGSGTAGIWIIIPRAAPIRELDKLKGLYQHLQIFA